MSKKILIADDETHIRLLIEQSIEELEDEGIEFLIATNGEEALLQDESARPDLILLDIMMPKMNGFEVCEKLRARETSNRTYIILLTAKGQEYDKARGFEVGADDYITKPFNPDELLAKVRRVLGIVTE